MRGELDTQRHIREAVTRLVPRTLPPTLDRLALATNLPADRIIKLDQNENPYGSSLRVQEALSAYDRFHLYPDPEGRAVRERLAAYTGMPAERIMLVNGADELIDLSSADGRSRRRGADRPADVRAVRARAEFFGAQVIEVPRLPDFSLDIDAMARATTLRTKVITLVSPNNPTGNAIYNRPIRAPAAPRPAGRPGRSVPRSSPSESSCRWHASSITWSSCGSFSKWAGLAGLRLGYGIFPADSCPICGRSSRPLTSMPPRSSPRCHLRGYRLATLHRRAHPRRARRASTASSASCRSFNPASRRGISSSAGSFTARPGWSANASPIAGSCPGLRRGALRLPADQRRPPRGYRYC